MIIILTILNKPASLSSKEMVKGVEADEGHGYHFQNFQSIASMCLTRDAFPFLTGVIRKPPPVKHCDYNIVAFVYNFVSFE